MLNRLLWGIVAVILPLASIATAQDQDCGEEGNPCQVGQLTYRVVLPEVPQNAPSVIYLHGYAATADSAVKRPNLTTAFIERGIAVIVPNGQADVGNPKVLDWGVHDGHRWPRDDLKALDDIKADAVGRFGLDGARILLAGYSRGGSMVWDKACYSHDFASAYASASGAFWEPMWRRCSGPVHMHHSHGFADRTVPLEGRFVVFGGYEFEQGSVFKSVELLTRTNECGQMANAVDTYSSTWEKRWTKCKAGSVTLALGPHGHGRQADWADQVAQWFIELPATR
ncbi:putative hydrolase [Ruegeria sp. THAF57]|uniref:PHB depolymerase family esterase n=1 Tax=Ruegeria sp. THAF57 TaxID=2744555 RepID=UPI0015DFB31A|nr:PHB depolymerase family esterase [Ruegeria sp. THAF57]CAD0186434.1 putative hydrolase [Ruegeria sp. THAF57]